MSRNQKMRDRLPDHERENILSLAIPTLWSEDGKAALEYLQEQRGFKAEVLKSFSLGYVPHWIKTEHNDIHEFAGRLILPIHDQYNNLIALSSRNWRKNAFRKFFHERYRKSNFLFGLNIAKKHILKRKQAIIVEGEFDVICLHNKGFNFTVAALGSSFSLYQLSILMRYCSEIFVMFDADPAGKKAQNKMIALCEEHHIKENHMTSIIPVNLPDGSDPDEFLKNNDVNALVKLMKQSRNNLKKEDLKA